MCGVVHKLSAKIRKHMFNKCEPVSYGFNWFSFKVSVVFIARLVVKQVLLCPRLFVLPVKLVLKPVRRYMVTPRNAGPSLL